MPKDGLDMRKHGLEAQLMALTEDFVAKLVEAIRNASFAEVAALPGPAAGGPARARAPRSNSALTSKRVAVHRQTLAARRAELSTRILEVLQDAAAPLGVRALASEIGVPPDLLAVPIRELRASSRIRKHGEKRSTTYSAQ
jgi:hypothetical protein